jgi:hypothetical protein
MADLEVDPAQLSKDGDQFNSLAVTAQEIADFFTAGSTMLDLPYDDLVSRTFSDQWNALVGGVSDLFKSFHDGMTQVAGNIYDTAALYTQSNIVNTESVAPPPSLTGGPTDLA